MEACDDDLTRFEAEGSAPLPVANDQGYVQCDGARIWYATYGSGLPVILLHGGLGHSGNWGYQVAALVKRGYLAVVVDSRGHGRSTRDERPFTYELMAADVLTVMNFLQIEQAAFVGWSDGAVIAMIVGIKAPERVFGVFFFGCNMDPSGTKEVEFTPVMKRCFERHARDYAQLSFTPEQFDEFVEAVSEMMRTEPNYTAEELEDICVPVAIVQSEHDEFIKPEHAEYLAATIPNAEYIKLFGVSHFAPLQRPEKFNSVILEFLVKVAPKLDP
ncbi:Alpha/Beta hydrolase protein [Lipomyces kononenkoae]